MFSLSRRRRSNRDEQVSYPYGVRRIDSTDRRPEKYVKKLLGKTDIEDALKRLDKLTQEEVRMATAQLLTLTHGVDDKVTRIDDEIKIVDGKVTRIDEEIKGVDGKVTRIDDEVKGVGGKVNDIGDTVRVVHEGAQCIMFSYSFLRKLLYDQTERQPKQCYNRWQKRRLQSCN